jgi:hypothetical protein
MPNGRQNQQGKLEIEVFIAPLRQTGAAAGSGELSCRNSPRPTLQAKNNTAKHGN